MANYIQETLLLIDRAVETYAEDVFQEFSAPVETTLQLAGLVSLAFVALNTMVQWIPIRVSEYIKWGVRYVIVLAVATTWAQFEWIYDILTNTPSSIGAALLGATDAPNLNVALDQMVTEIFEFSDRATEESRWFTISLASIVLWILGAVMACVAIIVSAVAKIGLAMAVSLAPIFIGSLLFRGTSNLFTSWSRWTIGFALIPLVLAGMMGAVLGVGEAIMGQTAEAPSTLAEVASFVIISFAAIIMMSQVPVMVNGLAGTIVATTSGMREAQQMARVTGRAAAFAGRQAHYQAVQQRSAAGAALQAGRQGGGGGAMMQAYLQDVATHRAARQANAERYQSRQAHLGHAATWSERREAARAGGLQSMRKSIAGGHEGRNADATNPASAASDSTVQRPGYDPAAFKALRDSIAGRKASQAANDGTASPTSTPRPKND